MGSVRTGVFMVAAGFALTGCMTVPVELGDSTVPLQRGTYTEIGPTQGTAWNFLAIALFVPIGWGASDPAGAARDAAISTGGGEALVDVNADLSEVFLPIPLVPLIIHRTTVRGTAVRRNVTGSQ